MFVVHTAAQCRGHVVEHARASSMGSIVSTAGDVERRRFAGRSHPFSAPKSCTVGASDGPGMPSVQVLPSASISPRGFGGGSASVVLRKFRSSTRLSFVASSSVRHRFFDTSSVDLGASVGSRSFWDVGSSPSSSWHVSIGRGLRMGWKGRTIPGGPPGRARVRPKAARAALCTHRSQPSVLCGSFPFPGYFRDAEGAEDLVAPCPSTHPRRGSLPFPCPTSDHVPRRLFPPRRPSRVSPDRPSPHGPVPCLPSPSRRGTLRSSLSDLPGPLRPTSDRHKCRSGRRTSIAPPKRLAKAPTAHGNGPSARLWTSTRPQARLQVSGCAAGVPGRETRTSKAGLRRRVAGNNGRSRANVAVAQSEARLEADLEDAARDWNNCNVSSLDLDEGGTEDAERFLLAAVDMGTNSFHMVVVRADMQGRFKVVDQMKEVVRLGSGGGKFNIISEEAEQRAFAAMKRLTKVAETRGAVLRVVATSAVREARNGSAFIRHIKEETGIEVETVSGQEEARLIYMGVLQALPIFDKTVLTVDIGGGSTEFVVGREGQPLVAMSLKIGHLRLAERCLGGDDLPTVEQLIECRRYVRAALADAGVAENVVQIAKQHENVPYRGFEMSVGTSGSIEICAALIAAMRKEESTHKEHENGHPPELQEQEFKRMELKALVKMLSSTPPSQWKKVNGARDRHPHSVLAGAILLEEIFSVLNVDQMKISPYALREGVIVDSLMRALPDFHPTPDIRRESVLHLAQRFDTECRKQSALHSATLARQILEGLKKGPHASHLALSIDDNMAFLMEAGAMLHFVGMFISHAGHHKHAYYLIKNNEHLLGFSPLEVEIIAMLARYHRKKLPSMKHESFARLPPELREKIMVMCVIIRLAVALDRRNTACGVNSVEVLHDGDTCVLVVVPSEVPEEQGGGLMDISLELWAARQELSNFSEVFGLATTVVEGHPEDPNVDRDGILSS